MEAKFKIGQIVVTEAIGSHTPEFRGVIVGMSGGEKPGENPRCYHIKVEGRTGNIYRVEEELRSGVIPRGTEPPDDLQWPSLKIDAAAIPWREVGEADDPRRMLRAAVQIGPCWLNLEAWAAYFEFEDGRRVPVNSEEHDKTDVTDALFEVTDNQGAGMAGEIWTAFGMEGAADVIEIEGRWYCLFAYPYSG